MSSGDSLFISDETNKLSLELPLFQLLFALQDYICPFLEWLGRLAKECRVNCIPATERQQMKTVKILVCVLLIFCSGVAMAESLKEINFHGGEITFKIPSNWKEEYGKNGKGAFYEDAPDTGTLRLNVITMEAPPDAKGNLLVLALSSIPDIEQKNIERLANGNALAHAVQRTEEDGTKYTLHWWYLANFVPPNYVRIATYSYAIVTFKENERRTKAEIELLERQIKNAVFRPEL